MEIFQASGLPTQAPNQHPDDVQQVIQNVEVVGPELNPHHLASQKETTKYPPGSGTDLAKHLQDQASLNPHPSQFNHNQSNQMAEALNRTPCGPEMMPQNPPPDNTFPTGNTLVRSPEGPIKFPPKAKGAANHMPTRNMAAKEKAK